MSTSDRARARYVLAVLVLVYAVNFIDRNILSVLLQPIKEELQVSDTAMGFLTGFAFAVFYTFAGIPIARIADRGSRRTVIAVGIAFWSLTTAASGLARNFGHQLALTAGLSVCRGERVLVIDADLQDPPELLGDMWDLMDQGADVVYGQRRKRSGETWFSSRCRTTSSS